MSSFDFMDDVVPEADDMACFRRFHTNRAYEQMEQAALAQGISKAQAIQLTEFARLSPVDLLQRNKALFQHIAEDWTAIRKLIANDEDAEAFSSLLHAAITVAAVTATRLHQVLERGEKKGHYTDALHRWPVAYAATLKVTPPKDR